jgi:hypothetical protein
MAGFLGMKAILISFVYVFGAAAFVYFMPGLYGLAAMLALLVIASITVKEV